MVDQNKLRKAFREMHAEKKQQQGKPPPLPTLAEPVLGVLRVAKEDGCQDIRVGEIGNALRRAGMKLTSEKLYPPIARLLEVTFGLQLISRSGGLRFAIPYELPEIADGRMVKGAVLKKPDPNAAIVEHVERQAARAKEIVDGDELDLIEDNPHE
jgi:hypothetical protein